MQETQSQINPQGKIPKWKLQSMQFRKAMMNVNGNDDNVNSKNGMNQERMAIMNENLDDRV